MQVCNGDVEDEEILKAVEAAVRESTTVKSITITCHHLNWTNVATALLKGVAENTSLQKLTLQTATAPPQNIVTELKQKRRKLLLRLNVGKWQASNIYTCLARLLYMK